MSNPLAADLNHILKHTPEVWEELRDARIFVTGGTGFFGCWLLESYVWAWDRLGLSGSLTVLTRSPQAFQAKAPHLAGHPAIRLVEGDVQAFQLEGSRFTHIIHAATQASDALNREQPLLMLNTIVKGTRQVLDLAAASGARRFLFTSSGAVYGRQPPGLTHVPEDYQGAPDPLNPRSAYGEGKRMAELLCAMYAREHGIDCLITRGFAFTGPYLPLDTHFAIGNFIRDCLRGGPVEVRGDGSPYRSYLYGADLAIWLWTILARGQSLRPYNVGSECGVSIAELARTAVDALCPGAEIRAGKPPSSAPPQWYAPSTARARAELGLKEWIDLREAIRRTAAWNLPAGLRR